MTLLIVLGSIVTYFIGFTFVKCVAYAWNHPKAIGKDDYSGQWIVAVCWPVTVWFWMASYFALQVQRRNEE